MKKEISLITAALLLTVIPAYASNGQVNHGAVISAEHKERQVDDNMESPLSVITSTPKPIDFTDSESLTPSVTKTPCDPSGTWKNHGEYVSCVAHEHLGGGAVSAAAKSNIGKKDNSEASVTPTITPTGTITPTETPIASSSPSVTPAIQLQFVPLTLFESILSHLEELFPFLHHHPHK